MTEDVSDSGGSGGLIAFLVIFLLALVGGTIYAVYRYRKDKDCYSKLKLKCLQSKFCNKFCKCCAKKRVGIIPAAVRADLEDDGFNSDLSSFQNSENQEVQKKDAFATNQIVEVDRNTEANINDSLAPLQSSD